MIIDTKQEHDVQGDDFLTIESSVNKNKLGKLYGMLSGIYRNPIGAIVREYGSNAHDANKEAHNFATLEYDDLCSKYKWLTDTEKPELNMTEEEVMTLKLNLTKATGNEPIVVGIDDSNASMFYVQDYGMGLSPARMKHIYFNYLDSTKEDNNLEIGGFGIGCKSALSYTHTFFITTVYNNIEYEYIMTKDNMGIPNGQLLNKTEDCGKDNGTLIKVPIKGDDSDTFISEISKQLAYMDNVYFKNINYTGYLDKDYEFNESKIIIGDTWKRRYDCEPMNQLHMSIENVTYSIDWTELGMNSINVPYALEFKTGELQPAPSRESIIYTKHSIALIKSKIDEFVMGFVKKYNSINKSTDDFRYWEKNRYVPSRQLTIYSFNNKTYNDIIMDMNVLLSNYNDYSVNSLNKVTFKPFDDLDFKPHNIPSDLYFNYKVIRRVEPYNGKSSEYNSGYSVLDNSKSVLVDAGEASVPLKNHYILEELLNSEYFYFVRREKKRLKKYITELNLNSFPKSKWRHIITEYQKIIENLVSIASLGDYDSIHVNPNWHKGYKLGNSKYSPASRKRRGNGEIHTKHLEYDSWQAEDVKIDDIENFKGIVVYDVHDNKDAVTEIKKLLNSNNSFCTGKRGTNLNNNALKLYTVSKTNCKILNKMDNTFTPEELISTEIRTIQRIVTSYKINDKMTELNFFTHFKEINSEIYSKYQSLEAYINSNTSLLQNMWNFKSNDKFIEGLIMIADKFNLYDDDILNEVRVIEEYYNGVEILKLIAYASNMDTTPIVKYLKSANKKVNKVHYLKTQHQLLEELINKKGIYDYN